MGNLISQIRLAFRDMQDILNNYKALSNRLKLSPGLPVPDPTTSFWTVPQAAIAKHVSELPVYADVVVIGSGISGTSVARTLLSDELKPVEVVMLEARDICSGATGRFVIMGANTNVALTFNVKERRPHESNLIPRVWHSQTEIWDSNGTKNYSIPSDAFLNN